MDHVVTGWVAVTLLFGFLALAAIWARRGTMFRGLSVLAFFIAAPVVGLSAAAGLGWSVPIIPYVTAGGGDDYRVLGVKMVQNVAIFALLDTGQSEPRYYRMPWDQETADELQDMLDNPNNPGIAVTIPYEFSFDRNAAQFWPLPQPPAMPPKQPQEKPAPRFEI